MKYGPPLSAKLRAQIVSATHNAAPSRYTLHSGLIVTIFRRWSVDCAAANSHSLSHPAVRGALVGS